MVWRGVLLLLLAGSVVQAADLEVLYRWNLLDYDLPKDFPSDSFVAENNVFTGLELGWNRVFLAVPRLRNGVPATLVTFNRDASPESPKLQAYPDWSWHSPGEVNCSGLISVYRMRADRCDRLWVLDSGLMDSLITFTPVCEPKLLAFDLRTDRLVRSVVFPSDVRRLNSLFTNLVLDESPSGNCDDMMIYISDTTSPGVVVYDVRRDATWRVGHPTMWPNPDFMNFEVAGESFTLMDGIVGLALSPPAPSNLASSPLLQHLDAGSRTIGGDGRVLYFQPMATDRLFSVPTSVLRAGPLPDDQELPVTLVGHKSSQSASLAVDQNDGSVYFSPVRETALAAYSPSTRSTKVVAFSPDLLQFSSEVIMAPRDGGRLWMLSSRFQKYFRRTYNRNEVNLRVMRLVDNPPLHGPPQPFAQHAFPLAASQSPYSHISPINAYRIYNHTFPLYTL